MSRPSRSLSVKRRKSVLTSSSQESASAVETSERKKTKISTKSTNSKESILQHFGRKSNTAEMATNEGNETLDSDPCNMEEEMEPTNRDIMKMLRAMNTNLTNKLDQVTVTVDKLKGEVFDLQQDNDQLKTELLECKRREEEMRRKMNEAVFEAKLAAERSDRNEQYSRRNNVKLLYVEEKKNGFETADESEEKALHIFRDKLGLKEVKPEHIEAAHRVGERKDGHTRPIIVKFISRKTKKEVIQNRKKLKNVTPKVVIVEDLTKQIYTLFCQVKEHPGTVRCWTSEGKIYASDLDLKVHRIETLADMRKLSIDAPPLSSNPAGLQFRRQQFQRAGRRPGVPHHPQTNFSDKVAQNHLSPPSQTAGAARTGSASENLNAIDV